MKYATVLISLLLLFLSAPLFAEQNEFDPFPKNRGSLYEYNQADIPDICFFPKDKARWDGSKITNKEWVMFTDFQKASFVSEYIKEIEKEHKISIEINGWEYLIALNSFVDVYDGKENIFMTQVLNDILKEQGKIK